MARPVPWRGVGLAACVAVSYATNSVFAGVSFAGGSNAASVFATRSTVAFIVLYLVLRLRGQPCSLPPAQRPAAFLLGLLIAMASYALLAAMEHMPVALCVLTLYTYPLIVACIGWTSGREPFRPRYALALLVAFAGLVLALDPGGGSASLTGVGLAFSAALGVSLLLVANERIEGARGSPVFTLHMLGVCMALSVATLFAFGEFALPHTPAGWLGFVATPTFYSFSIIFMFVAVAMVGSMRTSLIMNLEPVASVVLGYLLLDQRLNATQLAGVALVVGAIMSIEGVNAVRANRRPRLDGA